MPSFHCNILMTSLLALALGCSGKAETTRLDGRFGASNSQIQNQDDERNAKGDDGNGDKGSDKITVPANVAGGYLMGFDNARVSCDFFNESTLTYKVVCRVAAIQADGSTRPVVGLKAGVTVVWQESIVLTGSANSISCTVDATNLKQTCDVQAQSNALVMNLGFNVAEPSSQRLRTETSMVHLPYSVGVAAGLILSSSQLYAPSNLDPQAAQNSANVSSSSLLGFQAMPPKMANQVALYEPGAMCWSNGSTFFAVRGAIWELRDGKILLFAGSATTRTDDLSHRFRVRLSDYLRLACTEKTIAVSDMDRILAIDRSSGSVRLVTGKGVNGFWDSQQNLVLAEAGQLVATSVSIHGAGGIAMSSDGTIWAVDLLSQRIFRVDANGKMRAFAGTGSSGFSGDGGLAKVAQLNGPEGLALGSDLSLFVADHLNNRIRKITAAGIITTIAGTGDQSSAGDGGQAAAAKVSLPSNIVVGVDQSVYFTENSGNRVRKIAADGIINTVAGTGAIGFSGDGGQGSQAKLHSPLGLALVDGRTLLIADSQNNRIRQIDSAGKISTIAGNGQRSVSGNSSLAVSAQFESLSAIAIASDHSMYLADQAAGNVRRVNVDGQVMGFSATDAGSSYADGGQIGATRLANPVGLAFGSGQSLYVVQGNLHRVRKVSSSGVVSTAVGLGTSGFSGDGGAGTNAKLNGPSDIAVGSDQSLFIADRDNHRIRKVDPQGVISTVAGDGSTGELMNPESIALASDQSLYIADTGNGRIRRLGADGTLVTLQIEADGVACSTDSPQGACLHHPKKLRLGPSGEIYVIDVDESVVPSSYRLSVISEDGGKRIIRSIFGRAVFPNVLDCGIGKIASEATSVTELAIKVQASLATMCAGDALRGLEILDTCQANRAEDRKFSILFSQEFTGAGSNVIEIQKPCPGL